MSQKCDLLVLFTFAIPYNTMLYHTMPYHAIPYHTIPYHTIPYDTIPYHTIPYHTIPYHTIVACGVCCGALAPYSRVTGADDVDVDSTSLHGQGGADAAEPDNAASARVLHGFIDPLAALDGATVHCP